jgi:hydroxyacylglutathione hydrolase
VGGVLDLKKNILGHVTGPLNNQIEGLDYQVTHGMEIESCGLKFEVIEIPGHTLDHIAYYLNDHDQPRLFCGDTLFSGGCGRVFEGTHAQMYESLEKLQKLPSNTLVYSAHEYTLANLEFARQVEQDNRDISEYIHLCQQKIKDGLPTLPSSLEIEHRINPFMRCADSDLRQAIAENMQNSKTASDAEIFSYLREWKDSF